ncbi:MAG: NIPSNAP family protein [Bacteroidota bacterium]|nr:NIPSNAP family protein [Bacteroidota bacterium]
MKKRISLFFRGILSVLVLASLLSWSQAGKPTREYYQLTVYHFSNEGQEKIIDDYLQNALLPALHRMSIKQVGVFKALANDTSASKLLYVLIPVKSLEQVTTLREKLDDDKDFQQAGAAYINATYTEPPYTRIETILLRAFPLAPQMQAPDLKAAKKDRVYELRSYESATEKIFRNKVQMFNQGDEIGLFKRLNFNAVFYSEVIAGSKMPNLMYMTSFENMADRDAHWKSFSNDPDWKRLSAMPEYQHNVAHVDITFLHPVDYSDF